MNWEAHLYILSDLALLCFITKISSEKSSLIIFLHLSQNSESPCHDQDKASKPQQASNYLDSISTLDKQGKTNAGKENWNQNS